MVTKVTDTFVQSKRIGHTIYNSAVVLKLLPREHKRNINDIFNWTFEKEGCLAHLVDLELELTLKIKRKDMIG